ncbi:hypothetical protein VL20_5119 [Microcystis panniformis FACHB-1757]|uniref:Uncharacterized protein n=1 Tax=Microcystis panniformis FACHB-1757 TaxID=1638788 RepID=A0A0K1S754_9CHRO|nr:hypothetical protein VL20_5119 [Microcystis panniformis FACHB-1757]
MTKIYNYSTFSDRYREIVVFCYSSGEKGAGFSSWIGS